MLLCKSTLGTILRTSKQSHKSSRFTIHPYSALTRGDGKSVSLLEAIEGGNILAYGDSLTSGTYLHMKGNYCDEGVHPYSLKLQELLNDRVKVIERGMPGATTNMLLNRLPRELTRRRVDLVMILGGTNDVYHGLPAEVISEHVIAMHETVLDTPQSRAASMTTSKNLVYTIAMTIPQLGSSYPDERLEANEQIRAFASSRSDRVALLELESAFDQETPENVRYWSPDGLHLSPIGYDTLGKMLYDVICTHFVLNPTGE